MKPTSESVASFLASCKRSMITFGPVHTSNLTYDQDNDDVTAKITINLPDCIFQTEKYIKFGMGDLQSNIGGYLGLYLGLSFLQVADLLNTIQAFFNKKFQGKTKT